MKSSTCTCYWWLCWVDGENANTVKCNTANEIANRRSHAATFARVLDGRKQPVRGLWRRGGRYYAQSTVDDPFTVQKQPALKHQSPALRAALGRTVASCEVKQPERRTRSRWAACQRRGRIRQETWARATDENQSLDR